MKFYILIVMMAQPGENIKHYLYDNMPFKNVEECQTFGQQYWQPLTNLASMKHGVPWQNIFCIPETSIDNELISNVLNRKSV